jgi:hypothetical protein
MGVALNVIWINILPVTLLRFGMVGSQFPESGAGRLARSAENQASAMLTIYGRSFANPKAKRLFFGCTILLAVAAPVADRSARAQTSTSESRAEAQDSRSDRIDEQEDAVDAAQDAAYARDVAAQPIPITPRDFSFRANLPVFYDSNPNELQSQGPSSMEADPEAELGWRKNLQSAPLAFSVRLRANTDRYGAEPQAGGDQTSARLMVAYKDSDNDQAWSPFLSYKGTMGFQGTFSTWTYTKNDFVVGLAKVLNFARDFHGLPISANSQVAAVWSLGFRLYVQRRLRVPGPDSVAFYAVPSITYVPSPDCSISLLASIRERWFDLPPSSAGTPRRDFEVEPILTIAYDPSTFLFGSDGFARQQRFGAPQIAFQIGFERRSSNLSGKSWNEWTVGPILSANWRF